MTRARPGVTALTDRVVRLTGRDGTGDRTLTAEIAREVLRARRALRFCLKELEGSMLYRDLAQRIKAALGPRPVRRRERGK